MWTIAGVLKIGTSGILIKIQTFYSGKCIWKCHLPKWRPSFLTLIVLSYDDDPNHVPCMGSTSSWKVEWCHQIPQLLLSCIVSYFYKGVPHCWKCLIEFISFKPFAICANLVPGSLQTDLPNWWIACLQIPPSKWHLPTLWHQNGRGMVRIWLLHGNTFCIADPLWREPLMASKFPSQRASNAELWCLFVNVWMIN